MTITVHDPHTGTEINLGPSDVDPTKVRITIFAAAPEGIARVVLELLDEYGNADFTQPAQCADGKWGSIGYVWNNKPEFVDVHEYP